MPHQLHYSSWGTCGDCWAERRREEHNGGIALRLHDPTAGAVKMDGHDVRAYSRDSLRAQMAVVFQDNFLFDLSIRDNIRLGNLTATDADVEAAAKGAEIHRFIQALPDGYDTMVG